MNGSNRGDDDVSTLKACHCPVCSNTDGWASARGTGASKCRRRQHGSSHRVHLGPLGLVVVILKAGEVAGSVAELLEAWKEKCQEFTDDGGVLPRRPRQREN